MNNKKLTMIADESAEALRRLMEEMQDKIQEAIIKTVEESQEAGTEAKFKIGFTIALNLGKNQMEHILAWSVKHTATSDSEIPNPDQLSISIESGGTKVQMGVDEFNKKVSDAISGKLKRKRRSGDGEEARAE